VPSVSALRIKCDIGKRILIFNIMNIRLEWGNTYIRHYNGFKIKIEITIFFLLS